MFYHLPSTLIFWLLHFQSHGLMQWIKAMYVMQDEWKQDIFFTTVIQCTVCSSTRGQFLNYLCIQYMFKWPAIMFWYQMLCTIVMWPGSDLVCVPLWTPPSLSGILKRRKTSHCSFCSSWRSEGSLCRAAHLPHLKMMLNSSRALNSDSVPARHRCSFTKSTKSTTSSCHGLPKPVECFIHLNVKENSCCFITTLDKF